MEQRKAQMWLLRAAEFQPKNDESSLKFVSCGTFRGISQQAHRHDQSDTTNQNVANPGKKMWPLSRDLVTPSGASADRIHSWPVKTLGFSFFFFWFRHRNHSFDFQMTGNEKKADPNERYGDVKSPRGLCSHPPG